MCFTSWWQRHKWGVALLLFVGFGSVCVQSETLPWHCLFRQFPRSSILLFLRTTTCKKSKQTLPKYSEITLFSFFYLPLISLYTLMAKCLVSDTRKIFVFTKFGQRRLELLSTTNRKVPFWLFYPVLWTSPSGGFGTASCCLCSVVSRRQCTKCLQNHL